MIIVVGIKNHKNMLEHYWLVCYDIRDEKRPCPITPRYFRGLKPWHINWNGWRLAVPLRPDTSGDWKQMNLVSINRSSLHERQESIGKSVFAFRIGRSVVQGSNSWSRSVRNGQSRFHKQRSALSIRWILASQKNHSAKSHDRGFAKMKNRCR